MFAAYALYKLSFSQCISWIALCSRKCSAQTDLVWNLWYREMMVCVAYNQITRVSVKGQNDRFYTSVIIVQKHSNFSMCSQLAMRPKFCMSQGFAKMRIRPLFGIHNGNTANSCLEWSQDAAVTPCMQLWCPYIFLKLIIVSFSTSLSSTYIASQIHIHILCWLYLIVI